MAESMPILAGHATSQSDGAAALCIRERAGSSIRGTIPLLRRGGVNPPLRVAGMGQNQVSGEEIFDREAQGLEYGDFAVVAPGW